MNSFEAMGQAKLDAAEGQRQLPRISAAGWAASPSNGSMP